MKKLIALLLAVVLCLSLAACSSNKANDQMGTTGSMESVSGETTAAAKAKSLDELLAESEEINGYQLNNDYAANPAKAVQDYCNKTLNITGMVTELYEDYVVLDDIVNVFLPLEEMVDIEYGKQLSIVGVTAEKTEEVKVNVFGGEQTIHRFVLENAHISKDHFVIHGWYQTGCIGLKDEDGKRTDNKLRTLKWAEGVDSSQYLNSDITVSVICIYNAATMVWSYYDATIVE